MEEDWALWFLRCLSVEQTLTCVYHSFMKPLIHKCPIQLGSHTWLLPFTFNLVFHSFFLKVMVGTPLLLGISCPSAEHWSLFPRSQHRGRGVASACNCSSFPSQSAGGRYKVSLPRSASLPAPLTSSLRGFWKTHPHIRHFCQWENVFLFLNN